MAQFTPKPLIARNVMPQFKTETKRTMKKLEVELNNVFQEYKEKYISVFDQSEGINAKLNNQIKFTTLSYELTDKLSELTNIKRGSTCKIETEEIIKKLVLEFSQLFHNPFAGKFKI